MSTALNAYSINKELLPNERIIWKGKPATGIKLRQSDIFVIPFSLVWGGFAIFWEISALTQIPKREMVSFVFPLFGIPFVLMGIYLIFGRFIVDAKNRAKTEYAITNQRIIIKSGIFSNHVKTIKLSLIPETSFTEKSDGSGTIIFGESTPAVSVRINGHGSSDKHQAPSFEMIGNVRKVYELFQNAQKEL